MAPARRLLDADFRSFLETASDEWLAEGYTGAIIGITLPMPHMRVDRRPRSIDGRVGYHCHVLETAITLGT